MPGLEKLTRRFYNIRAQRPIYDKNMKNVGLRNNGKVSL
jgi:hypothetical protein